MDDIDCTKVLHALYEFLDDELTSERRRHVESHLTGCPHCYSVFDFEAELRIVVRSRLRAEVPTEVRVRIVAALEREGLSPLPPGSTGLPGPYGSPAPGGPLGGGPPSFGGGSGGGGSGGGGASPLG